MGERDTIDRTVTGERQLWFVPLAEIRRVRGSAADGYASCALLSDICRINTLYMIMQAGSGHIGSSFSAMDIITWLWTRELISPNAGAGGRSDTYFSSKGHDAPALYALLIGLEKLPFESIHKLRRLGGLPGHPDVGTPYIATNTGSLGMGISKAYGMALANRRLGRSGQFYVMTGDGELQEGQIWESLQPIANAKASEITVIVDHNKMQSDATVSAVSDLGDLEAKFVAFGWAVARCDGHDFRALQYHLGRLRAVNDRPQVLIADTIKGKGVSFMEGVACGDETYRFHAGAPSHADYCAALAELVRRLNAGLERLALDPVGLESAGCPSRPGAGRLERLVAAYGDELLLIARQRADLIVLDADLISDCGILEFKQEFPDRFVECGIAEQHMVSTAGGLALRGMLPVVHSFACFLSARANEHIYNNATERRKIIYTATLAGLLPGGPGHSHQSVRDISALGAVPGLVMIEPCNEQEARMAIRWAVEVSDESTYLRFVNVPLDLPYALPEGYQLQVGRGARLADGDAAVIAAHGPVMLRAAIGAAEQLRGSGVEVAVVSCPWLNRVDEDWLSTELGRYPLVVTIDDHYTSLGQGTLLAGALARRCRRPPAVLTLGVESIPACGSNAEVLAHHGLDADSIARQIHERLRSLSASAAVASATT